MHKNQAPTTPLRMVFVEGAVMERILSRLEPDNRSAVSWLVGLLTFVLIVVRARFYFLQQPVQQAMLDIAALALFAGLTVVHRKWLYFGLIALLPASSLTYLPAGLLPYDLTSVLVLLTVAVLVRPQEEAILPQPFRLALYLYAGLGIYLLGFLSFESFHDLAELKAQFKALYFIGTAALTAFLFAKVYRDEDWRWLLAALRLGIFAYLLAASLGYLYPLTSFTWEAGSGFYFKSLFRYPGMSSSNYVANLLLIMIAMQAYLMGARGKPREWAWNLGLLALVAVLSQSRGFVVGALVLIGVWWLQSMLGEKKDSAISSFSPLRILGFGALAAVAATAAGVFLQEFFVALSGQFLERFGGLAMANIDARLAEWRETRDFFDASGTSLLTGYHMFPDEIRPHSLALTSVLLFGVPIALLITLAFVLLVLRFPYLLFVFVVAQTEILFATGLYDAMFLIFLLLVTRAARRAGPWRGTFTEPRFVQS